MGSHSGSVRGNKQIEAGIGSSLEFAMLFARWADGHREIVSFRDIMERWGCSRATAYRYRNAYIAVKERVAA